MVTFLSLFFWVWNPLWIQLVLADNIACIGKDLDWYTSVVGETPCRTYERLRQICNSNFQVGVMNINTPPDYCTDQVGDCCCNSIAFSLSMLCLNCQLDNNSQNGIDAGAGAYQMYLAAQSNPCPVSNQSLPERIQTATCNKNMKIMDGIYSLFWSTGDWFYTFVRESLETDISSKNGKVFSHCSASDSPTTTTSTSTSQGTSQGTTTSNTPTSSPTTSPTGTSTSVSTTGGTGKGNTTPLPPPSTTTSSDSSSPAALAGSTATNGVTDLSTSNGLAPGVIAGIVVAVVLALLILAIIAFLCYRRKKSQDGFVAPFENYAQNFSSPPVSYYNTVLPGWSTHPASERSASTNPFTSAQSERSGYSYPSTSPSNPDSVRFAPVPALAPTPARREKGGQHSSSNSMSTSERHDDAGPVRPTLGRSPSGRLPPAYNRDWEDTSSG